MNQSASKKRVGLVVQRYGDEIIGGAEHHAKVLAEYLHQKLAWNIEVLTTRAKDYRTWKNELPHATSTCHGIKVKRFGVLFPRIIYFNFFSRMLRKLRSIFQMLGLQTGVFLSEWIWFIGQGPYCPSLARYLKAHQERYDALIFFTYLYYPTIAGIRQNSKAKKLLIPTAHDEPPFYFETTKTTLTKADVILANSVTERKLIASTIGTDSKIVLAGLGIDTDKFKPSESKQDYILYLGRISRGKGVDKLISYYLNSGIQTPLYLAGHRESEIGWPENSRIKYLGSVSDEAKYKIIAEAKCVINPSSLESLSLIVMEALSCMVPVLLNRACEVFRYYEAEIPAVFGFDNESSFRQELSRILEADWNNDEHIGKLDLSRKWVIDRYSWDQIVEVFNHSAGS